jgi:hypothetical protein
MLFYRPNMGRLLRDIEINTIRLKKELTLARIVQRDKSAEKLGEAMQKQGGK